MKKEDEKPKFLSKDQALDEIKNNENNIEDNEEKELVDFKENIIENKTKKKHKKKKSKSLFKYKNNLVKNEINEENEKTIIEKEIKKKEKIMKKCDPNEYEMEENLTKSLANYRADNTFVIFNSVNNILFLVYTCKIKEKNNSIVSYNLIDYKKINEIKNAHNEEITNYRHYLDKINKRDLIISISAKDNNIRLWNIHNVEFLLSIRNINRIGFLKSACFLNHNNQLYIISSNYNHSENADPIKVYDLAGNKVKEINYENNHTFFIDTYYDQKLSINYIITGNYGYVKSYDYNNSRKYHKYKENKHIDNYEHHSAIIIQSEDIIKLIDTSQNSEIRIWDFHEKELLSKIQISDKDYYNLYGISLLNNQYLFAGCGNTIKLVDLDNEEVISTLTDSNYNVITIKTITHPKFGECLISQDLYEGQIKLWVNKNNKYKYIIDEL